jgi:DNA polymerase-3 subunit epsilon
MDEIVLDTETTGLDPGSGHRLVEIGCLELHNHLPTGRTFHAYLNPERDMPAEAERVHGLSSAFLKDKPRFAAVVEEFLAFIKETPLIIHNASFDLGFLNAELRRLGLSEIPLGRAIDTLALARRILPPGAQASLDALCRRYGIDNTARELHGALLDARLLAEVYLALKGGRQPGLALAAAVTTEAAHAVNPQRRPPRPHSPSADEQAHHEAFIATLKNSLWKA